MKQFLSIALCIASLSAGSQALAAKVYKWVDENGVTHFSEHKPNDIKATEIKPNTGHSEPVSYVDVKDSAPQNVVKTEASARQEDEAKIKQALKDPTRCAAARKNLETLQNFGRVKVKDEDGEGFHYLTPAEQSERLKTTQQAISEAC